MKKNEELLAHWVQLGYAVKDLGDGAWGWSKKGEKEIPGIVRVYLSNILYYKECTDRVMREMIEEAGFNPDTGKMLSLSERWGIEAWELEDE